MIKDIQLSPEFKKHTTSAITAITFFSIIYILLLALAIGLTVLCAFAGLKLIMAFPRFITIALGVGLIAMGALILIFLVKFIFKSNKIDRSHLTEIKKADEPKLFALIESIVEEVGTTFPKKVYLSTDVNAAVFYDSNFWSMFLPIRKNLQIGLGLVNTVTHDELKAILAHEFGHFSQKTMKVGSYVYNVNQVIFNMLYDNEGYDKIAQSWASASGYIAIFVIIAVRIVQGIQWILRKMYDVVNKSYMALSREMEFHADEIAANVTGYLPLKNSLLRMQLADHSFNTVLNFYEGKVDQNQKSNNIFNEQVHVMNFLAKESELPTTNNLPQVTLEDLNKYNKSKLVIKDQWASHPSTEDRIERLEKTNIIKENENNQPANSIFNTIEVTQKTLTQKLFKDVVYKEEPAALSFEKFKLDYHEDYDKNRFSKIYNEYYDNKNPIKFEPTSVDTKGSSITLESIFSDKKVNLVLSHISLQSDLENLKLISDKSMGVKTFDYDGKKYRRKESASLLKQLTNEKEALEQQILDNDKAIYSFFKAKDSNGKLDKLYSQFFGFDETFDTKYGVFTKISDKLQFISQTTPFEEIQANFRHLTSSERELKEEIKRIVSDDRYKTELSESIQESFEKYLSQEWTYFGKQAYFEDNLNILFTALNNYAFILSRGYFVVKKELLDYQDSLLK